MNLTKSALQYIEVRSRFDRRWGSLIGYRQRASWALKPILTFIPIGPGSDVKISSEQLIAIAGNHRSTKTGSLGVALSLNIRAFPSSLSWHRTITAPSVCRRGREARLLSITSWVRGIVRDKMPSGTDVGMSTHDELSANAICAEREARY